MISKFEHGTRFQNVRSHGEAVIAMLQGLMSSEVELVQGDEEV